MVGDQEYLVSTVRRVTAHTRTAQDILIISTAELVRPSYQGVYSSHIERELDLRALGQTTRIERSTVEQVRARIAYLREKTKEASKAKTFDFEQRLAEVREKEAALRAEKKAQKKAQKEKVLVELAKDAATVQQDNDMMAMMGFSGFGTSKK